MLAIPEGKTCFVCTCDKCGAEEYTDETELEAARMVMRQGAWLQMVLLGKTSGAWLCPTCAAVELTPT